MPELELYHNDMSSCSQKVRLTLEEKNLTWKGHHMNLRKGETRSKEYIAKNIATIIAEDLFETFGFNLKLIIPNNKKKEKIK